MHEEKKEKKKEQRKGAEIIIPQIPGMIQEDFPEFEQMTPPMEQEEEEINKEEI